MANDDDNKNCFLITPEGTVTIENYDEQMKQMESSNAWGHDHSSLDGLEYFDKGYKLGMFMSHTRLNIRHRPNPVGRKIFKYLKRRFELMPDDRVDIMYGNVIIYDDVQDVTSDTWKDIQKEIKNRFAKKPMQPEYGIRLEQYRKNLKNVDKDDPWYIMAEGMVIDALNYGLPHTDFVK